MRYLFSFSRVCVRTDDIAGPEGENGAGAHLTLARFPSLFLSFFLLFFC